MFNTNNWNIVLSNMLSDDVAVALHDVLAEIQGYFSTLFECFASQSELQKLQNKFIPIAIFL